MLRVQLICTGKLKESFYAAACEEYNKRLQRYCSPEIIELPETGGMGTLMTTMSGMAQRQYRTDGLRG